jgi:hypothetical protein
MSGADDLQALEDFDAEDAAAELAAEQEAPSTWSSDGPVNTSRFSKKLILGLLFGLLIVVSSLGVLAYILIDGNNDDGTADGGTPTESAAPPLASTATVADDFDRPDSSDALGSASTGQQWEMPAGTWGVADEKAYVAIRNANEFGRSWAVLDLGSGNGSVSAKAATMANGWGIVFRYRGPFNYWMLQASTEVATYNLVKVVDGELEPVADGGIGLAPIRDGTKVGVEFQGQTITISMNDQTVALFRDPHLQNETKVGMIVSSGGVDTARWDDFTAEAAPAASGSSGG